MQGSIVRGSTLDVNAPRLAESDATYFVSRPMPADYGTPVATYHLEFVTDITTD
ncbi:hypothetical protein COMA1_20081 [Candidatus Nitrospira nitrosa]|uniref:Uncharacterized protein n=1 Tax=Candidatus Nitrospira nitrosa TaxID=1742972 RepID=A0A0S4LG87_9BACT|nr:hypothetical protein COMA1_20081 [Candidatus Nitrospira nitrosa]